MQGNFTQFETPSSAGDMNVTLAANGEPVAVWRTTDAMYAASCGASDIRSNGFEPALDATPAAVP